jgi:[glutamine synthetase] adenylyltransferase / [glutamine synthetase]-adenylyl-L-tyrosine phosphorylase
MRLLADRTTEPGALGAGARAFLLRETGAADLDALCAELTQRAARVAAILDAILDAGLPGPG